MAYFFIAQIKINDKAGYQNYVSRAGEIFSKYRGKYLAVDNNPEVLEGRWNYTRTVLIRFDSRNDFNDWYHSEEYQEILKYRLKSADCDSLLVEGLTDLE
jgi:uncharacterized protein (DUF1330 family)